MPAVDVRSVIIYVFTAAFVTGFAFSVGFGRFSHCHAAELKPETIEAVQTHLVGRRGLRNFHLAFLGDSTCRHIHASLIHFLHTGSYPKNTVQPNYLEGGFPTRVEHKNFISHTLNHTSVCDCFCPEGPFIPWGRMHKIWENSYFFQAARNNYVTHITKAGSFESHGHWDPIQIYSNATYRKRVARISYSPSQFSWRGNWEQTIRVHVSRLIPKPRYIVINAGLWPHDLMENGTLPGIRNALDDHGIIGIYRTTTKQLQDNSTTLAPHDIAGCKHLHYCMDLSWTGSVTNPDEYLDKSHFRANVNRQFVEQLLNLLQQIATSS